MSEYRATRNLKDKVRGDSWRGLPVLQILVKPTPEATAVPPAVAVASARMGFKKRYEDIEYALLLTTEDGTIVINDAGDWDFTVPPVLNFPLGAGTWLYDFETINVDGFKRTYLGGTMTITKDVS